MADVVAEQGLVQMMRELLAQPKERDWLGTRHGHLDQVGPGPGDLALPADQDRAGVGVDERLGQSGMGRQPLGIGRHDGVDVGRGALDWVSRGQVSVGRRDSPASVNRRRYTAISSSPRSRSTLAGRIRSTNTLSSSTNRSPTSDRKAWKMPVAASGQSSQTSHVLRCQAATCWASSFQATASS